MNNPPTSWQQVQEIAFMPASDPLWRNVPLPVRSHYSPLGVSLMLETNAPLLAERAAEVFGHWRCPDNAADLDGVCLRLLLHDVAEILPSGPPPTLMRAQELYFLLSVGQSLGFADRRAGFAVAYITPALMAHAETIRGCFVECLGNYLICGRLRMPLHAVGLKWAGRGVLLTGRDGAGKSTLAYACVRAGFQLLAEDIVYVPEAQEPGDVTIWGDSRYLHLLPDALRFFPELHSAPSVQQGLSETKLRVRAVDLRPDAPLTQMAVWGVCSLGRSRDAETRLLAADPAGLRHTLTHFKGDPPLDTAAQRAAAERLLGGELAHLEVGSDLDQAVAVLKRWLERS